MSRNIRFILAVAFLIAGALVACAPAAAPIPQVTIKAHDYSYEGPTKLNAGLVTIKLTNEGKEMHHAQLARLNDGVSMDQIQQAFQNDPNTALALVTLVGVGRRGRRVLLHRRRHDLDRVGWQRRALFADAAPARPLLPRLSA